MDDPHEIAEEIHRLSTYVPEADFIFNQFLIDADEPLLFHTGPRRLFPLVSEAVARIVPLERLRWISFGHVEADECGAMNSGWRRRPMPRWRTAASAAWSRSTTWPTGRPARSPTARCSISAASACAGSTPRTCRTAGRPGCSSRRRPARCSAATCSPRPRRPARSAATTSWARRSRLKTCSVPRVLAGYRTHRPPPGRAGIAHAGAHARSSYEGDCGQALHDLADAYAARIPRGRGSGRVTLASVTACREYDNFDRQRWAATRPVSRPTSPRRRRARWDQPTCARSTGRWRRSSSVAPRGASSAFVV